MRTGEKDDLRMRTGEKEAFRMRTGENDISSDLLMRTGENALRMRTVERALHFLTGISSNSMEPPLIFNFSVNSFSCSNFNFARYIYYKDKKSTKI